MLEIKVKNNLKKQEAVEMDLKMMNMVKKQRK